MSRIPFSRLVTSEEPCARKPVQVKIPESQYEMWIQLPAEVRNSDLREAIANIIEKRKDLLKTAS